jgi:1-deoxy-D-xylulose-5-phosphate reductoisomerase
MSQPEPAERVGLAILGSTGSVGRQALDVVDSLSGQFRVVALAARTFSEQLADQMAKYRPAITATSDEPSAGRPNEGQVISGPEGLIAAATHPDVDIVVVATSGHAAIVPTMRAIEQGKTIALANKETLVCAGELLMPLAREHNTTIRPVDSEHSAIWQALVGSPLDRIRRVIITASGGPFRETPPEEFAAITAEQALSHPTWSMGGKITVDSATLMNKGLEVIEAHWLFGLSYSQIDVLVHPQSIVHSLVEFADGAVIAQLGLPDMKLPIQYALTYPDRVPTVGDRLDLAAIHTLHFEAPDIAKFPALRLARDAGFAGRTYPTALSAADDEVVTAFLRGLLSFADIPAIVEEVLGAHQPETVTVDSIFTADRWARSAARRLIAAKLRM